MEDNGEVVYNEISQREGAQRNVLQHAADRDDTPVYLVEMPDARPEVEPPRVQHRASRWSRGRSILGGDTYELPESVDDALEQYVRKNITGFRKSLAPEDLDVEGRRRSLKYLEREGEVIITTEDLGEKKGSNENPNCKEAHSALKGTEPSLNINRKPKKELKKKREDASTFDYRPQYYSISNKKKGNAVESGTVGLNNVITMLPVVLETGQNATPFEDMGKGGMSRLKVVLAVESADDLTKSGEERETKSRKERSLSRKGKKEKYRKTARGIKAAVKDDEKVRPDKKYSKEYYDNIKQDSKPKSRKIADEGKSQSKDSANSSRLRGSRKERDLEKGQAKRNGKGTKDEDLSGRNPASSQSNPEYEREEAKRHHNTELSRPSLEKGLSLDRSRSNEDKSGKDSRRVSFRDPKSGREQIPYKGATGIIKVYRAEQSQQNPYEQQSQSSKTSSRNREEKDKGKAPKKNAKGATGGDGEKPTWIYAKAPKSKREMYAMKRYHIQIPDKESQETPFNVRFNVTQDNEVDMDYVGPIKITNYFSTNKYS